MGGRDQSWMVTKYQSILVVQNTLMSVIIMESFEKKLTIHYYFIKNV